MTSKATHGGRRTPGPGKRLGPAPLPPDKKREKVSITLPPWLVRWLKARNEVTKESTSAAVERALVEHYRLGPEEGEATK
jgi:hypothetical protein